MNKLRKRRIVAPRHASICTCWAAFRGWKWIIGTMISAIWITLNRTIAWIFAAYNIFTRIGRRSILGGDINGDDLWNLLGTNCLWTKTIFKLDCSAYFTISTGKVFARIWTLCFQVRSTFSTICLWATIPCSEVFNAKHIRIARICYTGRCTFDSHTGILSIQLDLLKA